MGESVSTDRYTPKQRTEYRRRLAGDLEIFDRYLQRAEFEDAGTVGMELELNLVDQDMQPVNANQDVLASLDEEYQSELGSYNVELNNPPVALTGDGLFQLEKSVSVRLAAVRDAADAAGVKVAMIGTLPTMTTEFLESPDWMTSENRYQALNNAVMDSRGEMVRIEVSGREHFGHDFANIAPESTCTSVQLHLQVPPERFADSWNASQAIAGIQVALGANSPLFCGRKLWGRVSHPGVPAGHRHPHA